MKSPKIKAKKILYLLLILILSAVVGIGIYNQNAERVMGNKMPMPFGMGVSVVLTGSMEPKLSVNDMIIVKKTDSLYEGQIVVFQDESSLIVHRIISIDGDTVITQGDANDISDAPITKEDIKGEVVGVVPFVGVFIKLIKHPIVTVLMIALAIFLMERSFRTEKEQKNNEVSAIKKEIEELLKEIKDDK